MCIDDDLQSCYTEEFDQMGTDPFIDNLNGDELWQYLQMIVSGEPLIIESPIDNEEIDISDTDQDDILIDSPIWSDEDIYFDPYAILSSIPMATDTSEYTDDEYITG